MSRERATEQIRSVAKFQVTKSQYFIGAIALFAILGLGLSSIIASNTTVNQAEILSDVETPAASIIFTQRETLVYATRLAQWSNGGTTRREVQIARNLLAQRLAVIDTSGRSMGSRAQKSYWAVMKESDAIVASAPPGILPESLHPKFNAAISPIIDEILAEARRLVVSYQRSVDAEMIAIAQDNADRDRLNLALFYIFIAFGGLFLLLNVRSNFKNYQLAGLALESEQRRLDETIEELKRTQTTVIELQDLNQAKNAFISTVNHELRTPLTSIIGYIDLMREEDIDKNNPEMGMYLDVLDRNAGLLLQLVESMLSLSRIDAAEGKLPSEKVCLNEIIDNAIFLMKPNTEKNSIAVHFRAEDELFVEGDAGQLNQVLINLIGNAIKFSPQGSTVAIGLVRGKGEQGRETALISVADQGIGIPPEDVDRLFTRFFRARNADSGQYPGTGLGLAIVQQVVKRHHGSINIQSIVGEGSTFTVQIPLYMSPEERFIYDRRGEVLARAITQLEASTTKDFKAVTHDIGGAIGLYHFEELGQEILKVSRSYLVGESPVSKFTSDKTRLLELMRIEEAKMGGKSNE
jgi:signal transduction histidine kinase